MTYILFIIGFIILIYGANLLVKGGSSIARKLGIPEIAIGLTIVSFGTSAPELLISLTASIRNESGLAIGNVLGSNIFNVFAIIGIAALVRPLKVLKSTTWSEIPFSLVSALLLGFLALDTILFGAEKSILSRIDGLILLAIFAVFLGYSFHLAKKGKISLADHPAAQEEKAVWKSLLISVVGIMMLFLGGRWIVNGATDVGHLLGLSEAVIGLTIVATATSLPELATSIVAARKNNPDIAIGNAIGSNIFNILLILGLSSVVNPLSFNDTQLGDVWMAILSHIVIFAFIIIGKRHQTISRLEGGLLVLIYIAYITYAIGMR